MATEERCPKCGHPWSEHHADDGPTAGAPGCYARIGQSSLCPCRTAPPSPGEPDLGDERPKEPTCPGPDRCEDDLCRGNDFGVCGKPSDRMLGFDDDEDDEYPEGFGDEPEYEFSQVSDAIAALRGYDDPGLEQIALMVERQRTALVCLAAEWDQWGSGTPDHERDDGAMSALRACASELRSALGVTDA